MYFLQCLVFESLFRQQMAIICTNIKKSVDKFTQTVLHVLLPFFFLDSASSCRQHSASDSINFCMTKTILAVLKIVIIYLTKKCHTSLLSGNNKESSVNCLDAWAHLDIILDFQVQIVGQTIQKFSDVDSNSTPGRPSSSLNTFKVTARNLASYVFCNLIKQINNKFF